MMKKLINCIERPIVLVTLIIYFIIGLVFLSLIISSIIGMINSAIDYYETRDALEEICLELAKNSKDTITWKDETFMGFGKNGSYGCYLYNTE